MYGTGGDSYDAFCFIEVMDYFAKYTRSRKLGDEKTDMGDFIFLDPYNFSIIKKVLNLVNPMCLDLKLSNRGSIVRVYQN